MIRVRRQKAGRHRHVDGKGLSPYPFPQGPPATKAADRLQIQYSTGKADKKSTRPKSASQLSTTQHRKRLRKRVDGQDDSERPDTSDSIILGVIPEKKPFRCQGDSLRYSSRRVVRLSESIIGAIGCTRQELYTIRISEERPRPFEDAGRGHRARPRH